MNWEEKDLEAYRREHPELFGQVQQNRLSQQVSTPERGPSHKRGKTRHQQAIDMIVDYAHLKGYKAAYFRPARVNRNGKEIYETPVGADGKGFPDLILAKVVFSKHSEHGHDIVPLEIKIPPDKVRPEQQEWLSLLNGYVINPFDEQDWEWLVKRLE